jgi:hypothetical protein
LEAVGLPRAEFLHVEHDWNASVIRYMM